MITKNFTLDVPEQHPCYEGHFPAKPVVPAALLLRWLQNLLENKTPGYRIHRVSSVKFLAVVVPGDNLQLACQGNTDGRVKFRLSRGETLVCQGSLLLEEIAPA